MVNATATISSNRVFSSTAEHGGGLYLNNSNATLSGNTISGNTAGEGGGVYVVNATATICNNRVFSSTAEHGGGLYLNNSNATLNGNTISDNTAKWSGGGLYLEESPATLSGNTITRNTAGGNGGGLELGGSDATLINNLVADNQANDRGCGLYIEESSPRLLHTTIARNSGGDSSGIYVAHWDNSSIVSLTNTILVSHGVGISVTEGNTVIINGVLWHDTPITVSQTATSFVTVQNQYMGDPAFVDPDSGDYHINAGSAAIDAGVDAGVTDDIDGDPRVDGNPDIGADERAGPALEVTKQAYPDPVQAGEQLTYTIIVTNTGNYDLHATITDTLPFSVTLDEASGGTVAIPGGTMVLPDGRVAVTWTPVITAPGGLWMGTIKVTVNEGYAGPLINQAEVTTKEGVTGADSVTVHVSRRIYLPLVMREFL